MKIRISKEKKPEIIRLLELVNDPEMVDQDNLTGGG